MFDLIITIIIISNKPRDSKSSGKAGGKSGYPKLIRESSDGASTEPRIKFWKKLFLVRGSAKVRKCTQITIFSSSIVNIVQLALFLLRYLLF